MVGDGRKGFDYRQTPYKTYKERAGDCEDTATLEQACYSYYGVATYVVGVNTIAEGELDHAATIVLIGGTPDEFRDILGDLVYYDIRSDNYNVYGDLVQEGTYMLVDNAYSDGFGISEGLEEGSFTISRYIPLEYGYGDGWSESWTIAQSRSTSSCCRVLSRSSARRACSQSTAPTQAGRLTAGAAAIDIAQTRLRWRRRRLRM